MLSRTDLHDYQNRSVDFIVQKQRCGLFLSMGLGKTSAALTAIADLIGDIDPIKAARGGHDLASEFTVHYGLLPRANRGIFAINELPDLAERIQVGLLNVLEERDVQVRGYKIRLPLDVLLVASANPDDYTNRGRIITPLKDRFGAQIRTHYPLEVELEMEVILQEAEPITAPTRLEGRVRYRDPRVPLRFEPSPSGTSARVIFDTPQRGLASGQVLALYDGERLLGGAVYLTSEN